MWAVRRFMVFYVFVAPQIQGQFTPSLNDGNGYLARVVDALWVKIKEYGISNLPVLDATVYYDVTTLGMELIGPVSFEDGFVQDVELVSLSPQNFAQSSSTTEAAVTGRILFTNLRLFRDFRADLSTGMRVGTVIFTPPTFSYELRIAKRHDNDAVVSTLTFPGSSAPTWDIDPDDLVNNIMRRQFSISASRNLTSGNFVEETGLKWIELFTEFIDEIIKTQGFPELVF